jgi:Protein of unknown function (DUF3830)
MPNLRDKSRLRIAIGDACFWGRLERTCAKSTCEVFERLLPFDAKMIHAQWSGEACWIPLGSRNLKLDPENATQYPRPGQILFYPGGRSETEILIAYGCVRFACSAGPLAGNHFATLDGDVSRFAALGREMLWTGARPVRFEAAE